MTAAELAKVLAVLQAVVDAHTGTPITFDLWQRSLDARGNVLAALDKVRVEVTA